MEQDQSSQEARTIQIIIINLKKSYNRWLSQWGISLSSEKKQRKVARTLLGDNLEAEAVPLTFSLKKGGEEVRVTPYCYIPDLVRKLTDLLDENEK